MSYVYEAMDRAKLGIKAITTSYKKYWDMIDKRWNKQLHNDLHAAGKVSF